MFDAIRAAEAAAHAYRQSGDNEDQWERRLRAGYPDCRVYCYHSDVAHAFVLAADREIIVAFRGTEPTRWKQWRADLRGYPRRDLSPAAGWVHSGFRASLNSLFFGVAGEVKRQARRYRRRHVLTVLGHSKGAAEATIAAARFVLLGQRRVRLITFGSPRVGTASFARELLERVDVHRFVNNNDYVPRVVSQALLGFRHVGPAKYFASDGTYHPESSSTFRFFDGLTGRLENLFRRGPDAVADHLMQEYVRRVRAASSHFDLLGHEE